MRIGSNEERCERDVEEMLVARVRNLLWLYPDGMSTLVHCHSVRRERPHALCP
jgi:hypothetical protein